MELGLDETDVCDFLADIRQSDFRERMISTVTGEFLYVFVSSIEDIDIYSKILIRENCVVISFHEDEKKGGKNEN